MFRSREEVDRSEFGFFINTDGHQSAAAVGENGLGKKGKEEDNNPAEEWLPKQTWEQIVLMADTLDKFKDIKYE